MVKGDRDGGMGTLVPMSKMSRELGKEKIFIFDLQNKSA